MMGRSLLIVGVLATVGFIAAAALGYGLASPADPELPRHVLAALASSLFALFCHCWILLYLIGTGRVIRGAVREGGLDPALVADAGRLRRVAYPCLLLASALVIATFVLGAGVTANLFPSRAHHILFYVATIAQGTALWIEARVLAGNERLLVDVDGRLAAAAAA